MSMLWREAFGSLVSGLDLIYASPVLFLVAPRTQILGEDKTLNINDIRCFYHFRGSAECGKMMKSAGVDLVEINIGSADFSGGRERVSRV